MTIVIVAPGEGNRPIGILMDHNAEELSFPSLFCGAKMADEDDKTSYMQLCRWHLRHKDRRFAMSTSNIFFKYKKTQAKKVLIATVGVRKGKRQQTLTAGQVRSSEDVAKLINADAGYCCLRQLQSSPDYKKQMKMDLFAMIWQLGLPTWFVTFTSNDMGWDELIHTLKYTVDNEVLSDEAALALTTQEKHR